MLYEESEDDSTKRWYLIAYIMVGRMHNGGNAQKENVYNIGGNDGSISGSSSNSSISNNSKSDEQNENWQNVRLKSGELRRRWTRGAGQDKVPSFSCIAANDTSFAVYDVDWI